MGQSEEAVSRSPQEDVLVRPMRVQDLPQVLEIEQRSFPTPWSKGAFLSELRENSRAHYLVAVKDGRAVGYIGLWLIAGEGHITNVAVHPDYRGQGLGRLLMEAMTDLCRRHNARRMTLEVRRSNLVAQRLYKSLGFVFCGTRRGYYRDNGEDALIMWRELDPPDWWPLKKEQEARESSPLESPAQRRVPPYGFVSGHRNEL